MSHISKGAGRGEEVECVSQDTVLWGGAIHPMRREEAHSALCRELGWSGGHRCEAAQQRGLKPTPPKKKTNTLFAAKNRRFFPNSSSHFDLFPSTSFPLSSLFQSVSSFCFLLVLPLFPFFCGEQEEGIDCVDLFCCLNYMQPSEKTKQESYFMSLQCKKTPHTFYSIQGGLKMHLFNKVKDRLVICEKGKEKSPPAA